MRPQAGSSEGTRSAERFIGAITADAKMQLRFRERNNQQISGRENTRNR